MRSLPDTEANRKFADALRPGLTIWAWLTQDTFEQVVGFCRAIGKEYKPPNALPAQKPPGGQATQKTFVILDGAPNLAASKEWIRIERPFIGAMSNTQGTPQSQGVRDVTAIVLTVLKPVPKQQGANPRLHEP